MGLDMNHFYGVTFYYGHNWYNSDQNCTMKPYIMNANSHLLLVNPELG